MAIKSKKVRIGARQKNKYRIRKRVSGTEARPRLSVFRSGKHTYAQIISDATGVTLATASTRDEAVLKLVPTALEKVARVEKGSEGGAGAESSAASDKPALAVNVNETRSSKSVAAAIAVGVAVAKMASERNISQVVFDRNGFVYHGRVRAVAEGARAGGLLF